VIVHATVRIVVVGPALLAVDGKEAVELVLPNRPAPILVHRNEDLLERFSWE
jgi:hypothetical protein